MRRTLRGLPPSAPLATSGYGVTVELLGIASGYWIGLGALVAGVGSLLTGLAALRTARTAASHEEFEQAHRGEKEEP